MQNKKHTPPTKSFRLWNGGERHQTPVLIHTADVPPGKNCLSYQQLPLRRDLRSSSLITEKEVVQNKKHIYAATQRRLNLACSFDKIFDII